MGRMLWNFGQGLCKVHLLNVLLLIYFIFHCHQSVYRRTVTEGFILRLCPAMILHLPPTVQIGPCDLFFVPGVVED